MDDERARALAVHLRMPAARLVLIRDLTGYEAALVRAVATLMKGRCADEAVSDRGLGGEPQARELEQEKEWEEWYRRGNAR